MTKIGFNYYCCLIIATVTIFTTSCSDSSKNKDDYTTIHLKPVNHHQPMSKFIDEVEYIKLETPKGMELGHIVRIIFHNDNYYIRHYAAKPTISVFNNKGKFKYNIGRQGRGPGEYVGLHAFTINSQQNEVIIMDLMQQKMHYYNIEGTFLRSKKLPIHALDISYLEDDGYVFWVGSLYNEVMNKNASKLWNLYVTKADLSTKGKYLEVPKEFMGVMHSSIPCSLSPYNGGVNIVAPLSNYIYHYRKGEFTTKYYLNFGSLNCDFLNELRQYDGIKSSFFIHLKETGATYFPDNFFEFKNYLYFTFISKEKKYSVFYDKNNETPNIGLDRPVDDLNGAIFGRPVGSTQGSIISVIEPILIMDKNENFPDKLNYLHLKPEDNSILARYKVR
jgi:hypothetical protein